MISVLKSVNPELDAEAIRVVQTLPTFKPGQTIRQRCACLVYGPNHIRS